MLVILIRQFNLLMCGGGGNNYQTVIEQLIYLNCALITFCVQGLPPSGALKDLLLFCEIAENF